MALIMPQYSKSFSRLQKGQYLLESGHRLTSADQDLLAFFDTKMRRHLQAWLLSLPCFSFPLFPYPDLTHSAKHSLNTVSLRECFPGPGGAIAHRSYGMSLLSF